ncbi:MAG: Transposase [Candidatus Accumulibacter appositus]|uniref:Transposase n=1 Tax=Candidatus Accumulibacter appositus TaxID=1454003 RepID=A0A011P1V5_9PROT|nr:MAG: Transposase [Candidatus Accumulibacter appositus]
MAFMIWGVSTVKTVSDTVEDIAYCASQKEGCLRQFLLLKNGLPSETTFLRIFGGLDPKQFQVPFRLYVVSSGTGCRPSPQARPGARTSPPSEAVPGVGPLEGLGRCIRLIGGGSKRYELNPTTSR